MLSIASRRLAHRASQRTASRSGRRGFFTIIVQGHEGVRLSLGKDPVVLSPGIRLRVPLYHQITHVDMRERSVPISNLSAFTSDNVPVTIDGSLFFQVRDSRRALFNVSNYADSVYRIGTSAMRSIIGTLEYDDIIADRNKINKRLRDVIADGIKDWGIESTRFEIQTFEPSNREIRRQLEQQMEAERARRKQLLDTEAAVNVADGMKRKTILESEGMLQAQKNRAEGDYVQVVRKAAAHKEALALEAEGLAQQIETVAEKLGADRDLAAKVLLELARIEQFKAIASGHNNTIYFAKDSNVGEGYVTDLMEKLKARP